MKFDTHSPCKTCPYRRDVPVGIWDRYEFENLLAHDSNQWGNMFVCHQTRPLPMEERHACAGWMLDQLRRRMPCLQLRLEIIQQPHLADELGKFSASGAKLYPSIGSMCRANGVRVPRRRSA